MDDNPRLFEIFLDIQRGLPRQGPGCDEGTLRALSFCVGLPETPAILDIGCGPGMQTATLARAYNGPVTAVDINREYLHQLKVRARAEGVAGRIEILAGDMNGLPTTRRLKRNFLRCTPNVRMTKRRSTTSRQPGRRLKSGGFSAIGMVTNSSSSGYRG